MSSWKQKLRTWLRREADLFAQFLLFDVLPAFIIVAILLAVMLGLWAVER